MLSLETSKAQMNSILTSRPPCIVQCSYKSFSNFALFPSRCNTVHFNIFCVVSDCEHFLYRQQSEKLQSVCGVCVQAWISYKKQSILIHWDQILNIGILLIYSHVHYHILTFEYENIFNILQIHLALLHISSTYRIIEQFPFL